jgi:NAD(P)-dependent dehydrogenase (short-subunit alcohol dehydrogenase family)
MYSISGRTALITGGAKRIGKALCLGLAQAGANVIVHFNNSREAAASVAAEIQALGRKAWTLDADLADRNQCASMVDRANGLSGSIDILVNSASVFPENTIHEFTGEDLDFNVQVNAFAPLLLSRSFAAQQRTGVIVNLLDSRITDYDRTHAAYHISKRMLHTITRILSLELAPGIRVGGVAPGLVLPPPGEDESFLEKNKHTLPLQRYGNVESVFEAVRFLIASDFVTGQIIYVDGGRNLKTAPYC